MEITLYHVNTFTNKIFSGNPAAVCVLNKWLSDEMLRNITKENNLPVTAFLVKHNNTYQIRWLTPEYELDLCGHGSLAAGFVILNLIETTWQSVILKSPIELLSISRKDKLIQLDFPAKNFDPCTISQLEQGLGATPKEIYQHNNERCIAVFSTEEEIKQLNPEKEILRKLDYRGITVTAPGQGVDFVSRTFYPQKAIFEDAVTGASHCLLAPFWSKRLNKQGLHAVQLSARGGELFCQYKADRVLICGNAILYMKGMISI